MATYKMLVPDTTPMTTGSTRVLIVSALPPPEGGIASWTRTVLDYGTRSHEVDVVHVNSAVTVRAMTDLRLIKRLHSAFVDGRRLYQDVGRAIERHRPNVLHLSSSGSLALLKELLLLRKARAKGMRTVLHWHSGRIPQIAAHGGWKWKWLLKLLRLADDIIVLDRASYETLLRVECPGRVHQIANPIDESLLDDRPMRVEQPIRIVFVGSVIPTKGVRELVTACTQVARDGFELHLVGPYQADFADELVNLATARPGNWFHLRGPMPPADARREISKGSIVALPSYTEGFPYVILEAMASGRAIVASAVGAIPEMLDADSPRPCGLCLPPRDASALQESITMLLDSPNRIAEFGLRARKRAAEMYSISRVFELYRRCWAGESAR